jgi:hypothetical protein
LALLDHGGVWPGQDWPAAFRHGDKGIDN